MIFCEFLRCLQADETRGLSVVNGESWSRLLGELLGDNVVNLFLKHTVKQCLVSIVSRIQK